MSAMKAAILHGPRDLRVERVGDPRPEPGEVTVLGGSFESGSDTVPLVLFPVPAASREIILRTLREHRLPGLSALKAPVSLVFAPLFWQESA